MHSKVAPLFFRGWLIQSPPQAIFLVDLWNFFYVANLMLHHGALGANFFSNFCLVVVAVTVETQSRDSHDCQAKQLIIASSKCIFDSLRSQNFTKKFAWRER